MGVQIVKRLIIENGKKGIEVWKLNRKGFYNFLKYIEVEEINKLQKEYKGYEIINKIKGE